MRLYRDTWDIFGRRPIEFEKSSPSELRILGRARYYTQTDALFYSDDYTGGEPMTGPRGQYWRGDRELSPLSSFLVGGRVLYSAKGAPGARVLGLSWVSAQRELRPLEDAPRELHLECNGADDTTAMILSVALRAEF